MLKINIDAYFGLIAQNQQLKANSPMSIANSPM
jgi:hypothetical protein